MGNSSSWTQPTAHGRHGVLLDPFSLDSYTLPSSRPDLIGPPRVYGHGAARPYSKLNVHHGEIAVPTMAVYWPLAYPLSRYRWVGVAGQ